MNKKGFTLIELLVVVLIIGILSAVALPQYTKAVEKARATEGVTLMSTLRYAAERYRLQTGAFPGTDLSVLDIEVPGMAAAGTSAATKNFNITAANSGTSYIITASRSGGSAAYKLYTAVDADGTTIRCCGSTAPTSASACGAESTTANIKDICKAITSGHSADKNW